MSIKLTGELRYDTRGLPEGYFMSIGNQPELLMLLVLSRSLISTSLLSISGRLRLQSIL
jgi:hypothetical protein